MRINVHGWATNQFSLGKLEKVRVFHQKTR